MFCCQMVICTLFYPKTGRLTTHNKGEMRGRFPAGGGRCAEKKAAPRPLQLLEFPQGVLDDLLGQVDRRHFGQLL